MYNVKQKLLSLINPQWQVLARMWRKGRPTALLLGMQIGAATIKKNPKKTVWWFFKTLKKGPALWPSVFTSRELAEETQNTDSKEYMHLYVYGSVIRNSQATEASRCPSVDEWIKKLWYVYMMKCHLAIKKEWSVTNCDSIDRPGVYYTRWNTISQRKTNTIWFHLYVETKEQNKWTNKIETES